MAAENDRRHVGIDDEGDIELTTKDGTRFWIWPAKDNPKAFYAVARDDFTIDGVEVFIHNHALILKTPYESL